MDEAAAIALQTHVADLCGHLNVLHAQLVDAVVESLDGGLWEQWGIRSPEHWLAWQTGMSPGRAKQLVDTARRASELPATFAAFADGELSVDQVVTVAKYTPAHNDTEACELAKSATVNQLRHALSRYVHVVDPSPVSPAETALNGGDPRNSLVHYFDENSRYILQLNAPTDQGEIINKAIREARNALFLAGNSKVTWLQAVVEVCNRSLGTITSASRRERFRTYIHLNTDDAGGPAHAWFNGGPSLPDAIRDVLLCDGIVQPLWHTAGLPINVGRAKYITPPHTRRQVLDRDRTCVHPACEATTHLEVHHIRDWLILCGRTETCNLAALCPKEPDALHRGEFTMVGNPDIPGDLKFYDSRGRQIPNTGKPNAPNRPPPAPPPGKKYTHPTGERFDTRWLTFTDAPALAVN